MVTLCFVVEKKRGGREEANHKCAEGTCYLCAGSRRYRQNKDSGQGNQCAVQKWSEILSI